MKLYIQALSKILSKSVNDQKVKINTLRYHYKSQSRTFLKF